MKSAFNTLKSLFLVLFFTLSVFSFEKSANAGAISNWFNGLIDIKNPKQHKNSFYIVGGYSYNTDMNVQLNRYSTDCGCFGGNDDIETKKNCKQSGGHGFNVAVGYRYNFETSLGTFFVSPELSLIRLNTLMFKDFPVSDVYRTSSNVVHLDENGSYYTDDIYLKQLVGFSVRFGKIFYDRLLLYGRLTFPAFIGNSFRIFSNTGHYGYAIGFGAGIDFNITTNLFVRVEYNHYISFKHAEMTSGRLTLTELKLKQHFGILNLSIGLNFNVDDC